MQFDPPLWLRNAHVQTTWGRVSRTRRAVAMRREIIATPDGDEIVLDHAGTPSPFHVVLLHGLEGSSNSVYIQGLLAMITERGWSATAMNFRSCARDPADLRRMIPNHRPRFYHSGETGDFDFVIRLLAARMPGTTIVAAGASLGGNVLLKWLGEHPTQTIVSAAATISVPYDLGAGALLLEQGAGRFYVASFLRTMLPKTRRILDLFPETRSRVDYALASRARSFREFDEAVTAPLHGFTGAADYHARSSSIHFVGNIAIPVLCISAEDDPFLPLRSVLEARDAASPSVEFQITRHGGHTGFLSGVPWRCRSWAEERIVRWLEQQVPSP